MTRVAVVADTHLTRRCPATVNNLTAALAWARANGADRIVHLGDVTADGCHDADNLPDAAAWLYDAGLPVHAVPGNHDVGEAVGSPRGADEAGFDVELLHRFEAALGPSRWWLDLPGWRLVGLNSQALGDHVAAEREWRWLENALDTPARLGLFLHKPVFERSLDDLRLHQRYLAPPDARRLLSLAARRSSFVVTGHAHQYRRLTACGIEHIWAPSLAYVIPDRLQEPIGQKFVGLLIIDLDFNSYRIDAAVPQGVHQHDLLDLSDLYPHLSPS